MRSQQPELVARGLRSDHERETLPTSTPPEVRQGARIRLPSSLCKPSLRTYFDWEDSWNDDYSTRPTVLDLFAGAGGAALGLYQAGFRVVGVDIKPQPHYPFEFHQGDALTWPLEGFDAIWASPPCQAFSKASAIHGKPKGKYPELIDTVRQRLEATGKPWVIENVETAPLRDPLLLCGTMFGLKVKRHRLFECSPPIHFAPAPCACGGKDGFTASHKGQSSYKNGARLLSVAGHNFIVSEAREAMGIPWMNQKELAQAIPPAYSRFLGEQ